MFFNIAIFQNQKEVLEMKKNVIFCIDFKSFYASWPDIYAAIKRNALLENVTVDENGKISPCVLRAPQHI